MSHISAAVEHYPSFDVSPVDIMQAGYESCIEQARREVSPLPAPPSASFRLTCRLSSDLSGSAWIFDGTSCSAP